MPLKYEIIVDDKGNVAIERLGQNALKADKQMKGLGSQLSSVGGILQAAFAGGAMLKSIENFAKEESIVNRLRNTLKNAGADYDTVSKRIVAATEAMEKKSNYSHDEQLAALTEIIQFTGDYEGALKNLPGILDLAAAAQMDLTTAGRSYNQLMSGGMPKTLGKLDDLLQDLKASGASAAEVMAVLNTQIAGAAEADINPITQIKNELKKSIVTGKQIGRAHV